MSKTGQEKLYAMVTDRIIIQLESGVVPWRKPWKTSKGETMLPMNAISKKPYRGANIFMLLTANMDSPYWLTFKQVVKAGGSVKTGEKGMPVVYWHFNYSENDVDKERPRSAFMRYYTVFNVTQCERLNLNIETDSENENETEPDSSYLSFATAENVISNYPDPPVILNGRTHAGYNHLYDQIIIPNFTSFFSTSEYYATLLHELIHSTGHDKRLKRGLSTSDKDLYAKEELIAELGAAFLCATAGISNETNSNQSSYISGWLKALKDDKTVFYRAASAAQAAADHILGKKNDY